MSNCKPQCISGTFHSDGGRIGAHIRKQHAAALSRAPDEIRSRRTDQEWKELYAAAMAEKRKRES